MTIGWRMICSPCSPPERCALPRERFSSMTRSRHRCTCEIDLLGQGRTRYVRSIEAKRTKLPAEKETASCGWAIQAVPVPAWALERRTSPPTDFRGPSVPGTPRMPGIRAFGKGTPYWMRIASNSGATTSACWRADTWLRYFRRRAGRSQSLSAS